MADMTHPLIQFLSNAKAAPDAPLVAQGEAVHSRADILALSGQLAAALTARGIGRGDRVLLVLPNSARMVALLPAIWSVGGLPMFLSAKATEAQRHAVIQRYQPRLVVDGDMLDSLAGAAGGLGPERPGADDDASVVFTSGSSGVPKGVVQKGSTLCSGVRRVARTLGYGDTERILVPIPFAHDYGWGQMLSGLVGGHLLILPERDVLPDIATAINAHRPTVMAGVPSLYAALLFGISGFETADTASLRLLTSTGSAFSPRIADALAARIPQARLLRNYGLTETYRCCCLHPEDVGDHPGSVGRPIAGVEIRIVDETGAALPPGTEGEIVHLGAGVFDRYLDDPEATARTRRQIDGAPGVFTGDIGRLDADGHLTILGRRDRLIKSQDVRVNLGDVEEALGGLPGIGQVAVLPRQHEVNGTEIVAFAVSPDGLSARDIQRQANRSLPPHMRPRTVHVLPDLPRTSVGKVDYPALGKLLVEFEGNR